MIDSLKAEAKIINLSGIQFEIFIKELVIPLYSNVQMIEHPGKMEGSIKESKSKADIWIRYEKNGTVFNDFYAITTNKSKSVFGERGKVGEDIDKLIRFIKETGPYENPKIVYAIPRNIDPSIDNKYKNLCGEHGISFSFLGLGTIVNLIDNNLDFQTSHLGLFDMSGCVIKIDDFISNRRNKNEFLQNFVFRDNQLNQVVQSILYKNRYVILYGPSGCGKTRIALEVAKKLKNQHDYLAYAVKQSNISVIDDLKHICSSGKNVLLLVDDANKNKYVVDILNFAEHHKNVFVIFTIRNYVYNFLKQQLIDYVYDEYEIKCLSNDQIKTIVENSFPQIRSQRTIQYILKVSKGNLRFALITAQVISGISNEYSSLPDIVEAFYRGLSNEIEMSGDSAYENFICAISFFETLSIDDAETVAHLSNIFGFEPKKVNAYIVKGNKSEILNTNENETIVNMADQIFATYLSFKKIYVSKDISLSDIFSNFFATQPSKVIGLVQSILDIYGGECGVVEDIKSIFCDVIKTTDVKQITKFLYAFTELVPAETIDFSMEQLKHAKEDNPSVEDFISLLLHNCENESFSKEIVDSYLSLFTENECIKKSLVKSLSNAFPIKRKSIYRDYATQIYYLLLIKEKCKDNLDIVVQAINNYVGYQREETETGEEDHKYSFYHFSLVETNNYPRFRELLWDLIEIIIAKDCFSLISDAYLRNAYIGKDNYSLRQVDLKYAKKIIERIKTSSFEEKVVACNLLMPFRKMEAVKPYLDYIYSDGTMSLYRDFVNELTSVRLYGKDLEKAIKSSLQKYENYDSLLVDIVFLDRRFSKTLDWKIVNLIDSAFSLISENDKTRYNEYLIKYLSLISAPQCNLIEVFKKSPDKKNLFEQIIEKNIDDPFILSPLLLSFEKNDVDDFVSKFAFSFFTSDEFLNKSKVKIWGNENVLSLLNYNYHDPRFVYNLCKYYVETSHADSFFLEPILFGTTSVLETIDILCGDNELLASIYFEQIKKGHFFDNDFLIGNYLSKINSDYFEKCVEYLVKYKHDYHAIEKLFTDSRFLGVFLKLVESSKFLSLDFSISRVLEKMPEDLYRAFITIFISLHKNNERKMFGLSVLVQIRNANGRLEFLKACLENDTSIEVLRRILIMEGPNEWTGNFSKYLKEDINLLEEFIESNAFASKYRPYLRNHLDDLRIRLRNAVASEINRNDW